MAVQALYFSDRDGFEAATKEPQKLMFTSKAEADKRDKILELAEELQIFLQREVSSIDEGVAERCGLALAEHSETLKKALKKPTALNEFAQEGSPAEQSLDVAQ